MDGWIDLVEYAAKYGVSQSTLRRRIRAHALQYKMERGKYLVQDTTEALKDAPLFSRQIHYASPRQQIRSTQMPADVEADTRGLQVELNRALEENRRLKAQLAEFETLVGALETELKSR